MKKIRLLFLTLVALLGMALPSHAADVTVYIDPVGDETWTSDGAKISLNVFTDGQENNTWIALSAVEGNVLKATFDDSYNRMIVVRGENQDAWGWNQTENITPANNKLYKANGYNGDQMAYTVSDYVGYSVDFNTTITTGNHDFKVAKGWNHIVNSYDDGYGSIYYMNYSYSSTLGVGSTGCLSAYRQYAGGYSDGEVVKDILVTPAVNGTVKLDIKAYGSATSSNPAFVEVYAINNDGTLGELQKTIKEDIAGYNSGNNTEWATFELADLASEQKLGLRCQYVYIDNFTATSVNIPAARTLEVTKVANLEGNSGTSGTTTYFEQQSDGNLKVQLQVTLTNTGDFDFAPGDDGYTLTLASASYESGAKTYYDAANVNIPEALAAGETKAIDVDFYIPYTTGWKYYFVRENISGTTSSTSRYAGETAYESKFVLREAGSSSTTDLTTAQAYGRVSTATTRSFEIYNDGTAPLTIKSITLPEGFTSNNLPVIPSGGLVVAKKSATDAFNVTLPVDVLGDFSGNLTITYLKAGDAEPTVKNLAFSGTVLAEGTWFADFNGDKNSSSSSAGVYPAGSVVTSSTSLQFGYTGTYGSYDHYLKPYSSAGTLVMPKLTATAGAQLKYDAVRYQSGNSYYLKVYVSTDRKTWGEAKATINNSDLAANGNYTQTLTFDEAGDYYVAFELYGVGLDNVIGLTKTAVAHDVFFKETNLVAEAQTGKAIKPSVKAIPLTDEAAANYEVKYYVDGVAVATATSIDLETSATLDKTFTINFTPEDAVTTEHDTYIAFEFEGGTVIATDHQTLRVTNEPKFLFVAAATSVNQNTTNLTTAQTFGKTNTADVKSFKIYNQGTAPLTIKSIAAPAGFSVNKATEFVVAAGENEDVEVTFSTETPGEYSGNLVVTYEQEGEQTFELAFSGTKLDPTKWYANFDNPSSNSIIWPAGLVYESNVQTSYSGWGPYNYHVYGTSSATTNNKIITPKLEATAGETFSFDVAPYSNYTNGTVKVYLSSDRETWGEAIETITVESAQGNTTFVTKNVTIPAAGQYYVGIEITNAKVDEINGLTLVDVAHDWTIVSSNIPAEGMQNYTSTATVNVLNLGIADEAADYTVTAYVNGEAAGTGTPVAIPMSHQLTAAGTQLSVSFIYPKAGKFPVYLKVESADGSYNVATAPIDVTFAEEEAKSGIDMASNGTSSTSLLHLNWNNSESVNLYSATTLASMGLKAGDKISSITFKGYNTGSKDYSTTLNVWYEFTDDASQSAPSSGKYDTSGMTNVVSTERSWSSAEGSSESLVNLITINFGEPVTYTSGKGLRIVVCSEGSKYQSGTYFEISEISGTAASFYNRNDTKSTFENTQSWSANVNLPAIHFGLVAQTATLTGTVKNSSAEAIEGATVTLKADNGVEYSGTTAADGSYIINVIQAGLDFTATVEKDGYLKKQFDLNMGGASKTNDVVMYTKMGIVGDAGLGLDWNTDLVMTQSTEDPNIFTLTVKGVGIAAGTFYYKLRADGAWLGDGVKYELPNSGNNKFEFGTTMYPAGTYNLTFTANTTDHTLTLQPVLQLTLADSEVSALNYENAPADVTVDRTLKAGWNAMVLPFDVTAEEIAAQFGANAQVAEFTGDEKNGDKVSVNFAKSDVITANKPFLINLEAVPGTVKFLNKSVTFAEAKTEGTNFDFVGIYADGSAAAGDYIMVGGMLKYAKGDNAIKAYRSYLKTKGVATARISIFLDGELIGEAEGTGEATGIQGIGVKQVEGLYNMGGQKVTGRTKKGVYILNGKKVFVGDKH